VTFLSAQADMSGGSRIVAGYASRLAARGHEVLVVAKPLAEWSLRQKLRARLRGRVLPPVVQGPHHFGLAGVPLRWIDESRPIEARDVPDADVVLATWWSTTGWLQSFPSAKGAPVHFVQGYEGFEGQPADQVDAALRLPMPKIAVSPWLGDLLTERYGARDVCVIPNPVDPEEFHAPPRGRQARPTVGLLYAESPIKGCDVALDAIARLREELPSLAVVALSSHPPASGLPLPPDTEFHYLPRRESIRSVYARCDVWISAARIEGFGLPLLEACACRTPVIATRSGGPTDIVSDGENGYLIDVDDADALVDRLRRVLALPESDWRKLSDAAHQRGIRDTWEGATERFEAALERAAAAGKPS